MRTCPEALVYVSLATVLLGCGTETPETGWSGVVRDSAGIAIVENPDVSVPLDGWTLTVDLSIGVQSGDPDYEFGRIRTLGVGSDGTLYVLDELNSEISTFDRAGNLVRKFGQAGAGPGELGSVLAGFLVAQGDTILVPDAMNRRVNVFTGAGETLPARPLPVGNGAAISWAMSSRPIHRFLSAEWDGLVMGLPDEDVDSVHRFEYPPIIPPGGNPFTTNPVAVTPAWVVLTDGRIVAGTTDALRFTIYSQDGEVDRIVTVDRGRLPIAPADRDQIAQLWDERQRLRGVPPEIADRIDLSIPDSFPAFATIAAGPHGTLLIQRMAPVSDMDAESLGGMTYEGLGSTTWSVIDPAGRYIGDVELPVRPRVLVPHGDEMYAVAQGQFGEDKVLRIRIVGLGQ